MRREPTLAEEKLWGRLRDRQLLGLKFRRQVEIDGYIADFCCRELRLVVEVDGKVHETQEQAAHDANRDAYLKTRGYVVLRFPNEDILLSTRSVLENIAHTARRLRPNLPE
ncbi:MAG TPA: endonuclease domain-containing protein [Vicinamibacteria bacterium]